jgi:hypothetical protein
MSKLQQLQRSLNTARQHCPALPEGQVEYRKGHGYYIAAGDRSLYLGTFKHWFDFLVNCIQSGRVNYAALRAC